MLYKHYILTDEENLMQVSTPTSICVSHLNLLHLFIYYTGVISVDTSLLFIFIVKLLLLEKNTDTHFQLQHQKSKDSCISDDQIDNYF